MKKIKRARKAGIAVGVTALATMAFGASSAQAAPTPLQVTFDDASLTVGTTTFDVLEPPNTASATGTIDFGVAPPFPVNVPAAGLVFPDFQGNPPATPLPLTVSFDAVDPIVGTAAPGGTITTTTSKYTTTLTSALGACKYDWNMPFITPDPFTVVPAATTTATNGFIRGDWPANAFVPDPLNPAGCLTLNGLVDDPGNLKLGNGVDLTPVVTPPTTAPGSGLVPQPATTPQKKCKKGKRLRKGKCVCKKGLVKQKGKCVKKKSESARRA